MEDRAERLRIGGGGGVGQRDAALASKGLSFSVICRTKRRVFPFFQHHYYVMIKVQIERVGFFLFAFQDAPLETFVWKPLPDVQADGYIYACFTN